jgi:hypothetical protein
MALKAAQASWHPLVLEAQLVLMSRLRIGAFV